MLSLFLFYFGASMKVIFSGSRSITDMIHLEHAVARWRQKRYPRITRVVCGMCPEGVDTLAVEWAQREGIPLDPCPADWTKNSGEFDRKAGMKRNAMMSYRGDGLIAVWDGVSPGTAGMIHVMQARRAYTVVHKVTL